MTTPAKMYGITLTPRPVQMPPKKRTTEMKTLGEVEYAGFRYSITQNPEGRIFAAPLPGQHKAAGKDKHCRAAVEVYLEKEERSDNE